MKHLFDATTQENEDLIRQMVLNTITTLREIPEQVGMAKFALDATSAHVLAGLIEIGVAPDENNLTDEMRDLANRYGSVKLQISRSYALDLAKHIEIGMYRHENGVDDPDSFTLH